MLFLKNFDSFRLDTIGFLAILGEGSVQANYQVSTLSKFTFLPRLLPAPQAFIRPSRPRRLETASGTAAGTYSGNLQLSVNRIAHVLLAGHILLKHERSAYSVQCVRIRGADEEVNEEERDKERNERPTVPLLKPKTWGPLPLLSTLGLAMSVTLLILSIVREDGWALLATLLLSFLSTLIGFGSYWQLNLAVRKSKRNVPPADVVVIYPGGVFVVVKCNENVARALFFAPETCQYFMDQGNYQRLALVATMMLMFGVIALGNATLPLQISFGASYLLLNAGYWYVASLGEECHWDLTSFNVTPELFKATPAKATPVKATPKSPNVASEQTHVEATSYVEEGTFTRALWKAIAITGTASWVRLGQVAPVTDAWNKWLKEAEDVLEPTWSGGMEPPRDNGAIVIPYWHCDDSLTSFIKARGFTTRRPSASLAVELDSWTEQQTTLSPTEEPPSFTFAKPVDAQETAYTVTQTNNRRYVICEALPDIGYTRNNSTKELRLDLLLISGLELRKRNRVGRKNLVQLAQSIQRLLGCYRDRIVFLDQQNWLRAWDVDLSTDDSITAFFPSKDWLNTSALQLVSLDERGTLTCPRNREVATVRYTN